MKKQEIIQKVRRAVYVTLTVTGALVGFIIFVVDRIAEDRYLGWAKRWLSQFLAEQFATQVESGWWLQTGSQVVAEAIVMLLLVGGGVLAAFAIWIFVFEGHNRKNRPARSGAHVPIITRDHRSTQMNYEQYQRPTLPNHCPTPRL